MKNRLRRLCFFTAASLFYYSGLARLCLKLRRLLYPDEILAIALHRILAKDEQKLANSLSAIVMSPETFDQLLNFLGRHFQVVSLPEFIGTVQKGSNSAKTPCLITFDDGWRDNLTTALPILVKHGMPAVIFGVTDFIEHGQTFWVERLGRLARDCEGRGQIAQAAASAGFPVPEGDNIETLIEKLKHMAATERETFLRPLLDFEAAPYGDEMINWEEAAKLEQSGVAIESHTITHPLLVYEDDATVESELTESKRTLEAKLQKKVRAFAYPNGTWDKRVRDHVENAGYECAFTTVRGWHSRENDPFAIRRTTLYERKLAGRDGKFSPAVLALRLSGLI